MMRLALMLLVFACALDAREIRVTGEGAGQATLARLQSQIEPAFEHVANLTGIEDNAPVHLHAIAAASVFESTARDEGVALSAESVLGYAVPSQRRIVLNLSATTRRGLDPVGVLRHEIAHLVMGSQLQVARPLWFEEGVAQYIESVALNELIESSAPAFATFDSLHDLSQGLRQDARSGAAYAESREAVRLINRRHGEDALHDLMRGLQRGPGPFEQAFEAATGENLAAFEAAWLEDQDSRAGSRLARWLGASMWWVLGLPAVIIPLVWLLRRRRARSQVEMWEEQDKLYPPDPSWSYADNDDR